MELQKDFILQSIRAQYSNTKPMGFVLLCSICSVATFQFQFFNDDRTYSKWVCLYVSILVITCFYVFEGFKKKSFKKVTMPKIEVLAICLYVIFISYVSARGLKIENSLALFSALYLYVIFRNYKQSMTHALFYGGLIVSGIFSIVYSIYALLNGETVLRGTYENGNALCLVLVFAMISLNKIIEVVNKNKSVFVVILIILYIAIIGTQSRTGMLSTLLCLCIIYQKKIFYYILAICIMLFVFTSFKKDSSLGRAFIYKTTLSMLNSSRHAVLGYGEDGFRHYYMMQQSVELQKKDQQTKQKADNIQHPLSDILLLCFNYGIIAVILIMTVLFLLLSRVKLTRWNLCFICSIFIFSLFNYPFNYPITWFISAYVLASITNRAAYDCPCVNLYNTVVLFGGIVLYFSIPQIYYIYKWNKAICYARLGMYESALSIYKKVESKCIYNSEFCYNYASFLFQMNKFDDAFNYLGSCKINNYDTNMLCGDILSAQKKYKLALSHYVIAEQMCPNRFLPLLAQFEIYGKLGKYEMQSHIGTEILSKPIKVDSDKIKSIKKYVEQKMRNYEK